MQLQSIMLSCRLSGNLAFPKKLLLKAFRTSSLKHRINNIHERRMKLVYKDYKSSFNDLMVKDKSFRIRHHNLSKLAVKIFKWKINIASEVMKDVFRMDENCYSHRNETKFKSRNVRMARYRVEAASFA